ncbi:MAG: DUF916 domain-containing protein [Patescibacteria group bacterium]|nr:DUF916 domain-containing protein [Patescibacteria group bacterium]MDE2591171.1 DUF916 domain-containing protein [Patescibacteria group bacterium]
MKKHIFALLFVTGLLSLGASPVAAQQVSLGVYPPIIQIDATPPTSIKTTLTIQNTGNDPVDLDILLKPFSASEASNGSVAYLPDNNNLGGEDPQIKQRIQILDNDHEVSSLSLAPQQQKTLTIHIGLPEDEPPSDYYFSIVFLSKNDTPNTGSAAVSTGGIASNILLSIGPQGKANGFIKDFSGPVFVDHGPLSFSLLLHNDSPFFIVPKGNLVIKNMFGQIVGRLKFLPVNILARSDRYIPDDTSNSQTKLVWPEKALVGPYSVTITTTLTDQGPLFSKTIYFFAIPVEFIVGLILMILIGVTIFLRIKYRLRLKQSS